VGYECGPSWYNNYKIMMLNSQNGGVAFTRSVPINNPTMYGRLEDLKRVGDKVHFLHYCETVNGQFGYWQGKIGCASSTDGGKTFVNRWMTTKASNGEFYTYRLHDQHYAPNLAVSGSNVYVVWTQNETAYNSPDTAVYFRRSLDNGTTFSTARKLSGGLPEGSALVVGQDTIAAGGNYVYVVLLTQAGRVFLRRSTDAGATFRGPQELTIPDTNAVLSGWWPLIQADPRDPTGATVHVLWDRPTYRFSSDGGATFSGPLLVSPHYSWSACDRQQMAIGGNGVVYWVAEGYLYGGDSSDYDIFYRRLGPPAVPSATKSYLRLYSDYDRDRSDNMQIAAGPDVNFGPAMTVEAWVKPNRDGDRGGYFIYKADPGADGSWGSYMLGQWDDGKVDARIRTTTGGHVLVAGNALPNGVWSHVAMTYNAAGGENNFCTYVNGETTGCQTVTGRLVTGDGILYVGGDDSYRYKYVADVGIDELRLWNKARTQAAIKASMGKSLTGQEPGLAAYYTFDKSTKDITGHGNDGILMYLEKFPAGGAF
jgi:hypothetical protein